MDARGIDTDPGWVNRQLQELRRQIEALRSERRAAATTISDGDLRLANGAALVVDGGDVVLLDTDGDVIFRIGQQVHGDRGVTIFRDDGTEALSVRKPLPGFVQRMEMFDRNGTGIFSEGSLAGGIDKPYLNIPTQPHLATSGTISAGPHGFEVPVASGTFQTTHVGTWRRHNYLTRWRWRIACSDATTAAEVRVLVNGEHLSPYLGTAWTGVRAAGPTDYTEVLSARLDLPGNYLDTMTAEIQARRTAGTGTVTVALVEARGD
jgi:hypothetical protein